MFFIFCVLFKLYNKFIFGTNVLGLAQFFVGFMNDFVVACSQLPILTTQFVQMFGTRAKKSFPHFKRCK